MFPVVDGYVGLFLGGGFFLTEDVLNFKNSGTSGSRDFTLNAFLEFQTGFVRGQRAPASLNYENQKFILENIVILASLWS